MPLSDTEFRQLVNALEYPLRDRSQRERLLGMAFPNDPAKRNFAMDTLDPADFAYKVVQRLYHRDRPSTDLIVLLQVIQEDEGGDLSQTLQPYVKRLQADQTPRAKPTGSVRKPKLFVSYRRKSWAFTHRLVADLSKQIDADIFVDFSGIDEPDFERSILKHLRESNAMLLVISEYTFGERIYNTNDWVRREIALALELNKPIIPVFADNLLPPADLPEDIRGLERFQGIAFYPEYWEAGVKRLADFVVKVVPMIDVVRPDPAADSGVKPMPRPSVRRGGPISPVLLVALAALLVIGGIVAVLSVINRSAGSSAPTGTEIAAQNTPHPATNTATSLPSISMPQASLTASQLPTIVPTITIAATASPFDANAFALTGIAQDLTSTATLWTATSALTSTPTVNTTAIIAAAKANILATTQSASTQAAILIASYTKSPIPTATYTPTVTKVPPSNTPPPSVVRVLPSATPNAAATFGTSGTCKSAGELVVGSEAAYPPFEQLDTTNNTIVGFDVDLLTAIAAKEGFTIKFQNVPFETILVNLASAQYDLVASAVTITAERAKTVNFSDPYIIAGQVIIVRQGDSTKVKTPADLIGKKIGVQNGTTGADAAKAIQNVTVQEFQTAPEALQALANKQVDAVIGDNAISYNILLNQPTLNLAIVGKPISTENYGFAIRQDCIDLLKKVNVGLAAVIADGTYAKIFKKYFGNDPSTDFQVGRTGLVSTAAK